MRICRILEDHFSLSLLPENISVSFNPRLLAPELVDHAEWTHRENFLPSYKFDALDAQRRRTRAHDVSTNTLDDRWEAEIDGLTGFFPSFRDNQLRYVESNVSNVYCPIGCCQLLNGACTKIVCLQEPLKVAFLGLRNKEEEATLMDSIEGRFVDDHSVDDLKGRTVKQMIKETISIDFHSGEDAWAEWKTDEVENTK
jgi:hypothetical protein